jgi:hypothetical protein
MRKAEDVTSDEYAAWFYKSLSTVQRLGGPRRREALLCGGPARGSRLEFRSGFSEPGPELLIIEALLLV